MKTILSYLMAVNFATLNMAIQQVDQYLCEAKFIKGAGHFWIFEHLDQMLEELLIDNNGEKNERTIKK